MSESQARFAATPLTESGTPPELWEHAATALPVLSTEGCRRIVCAVAHPDDEVLGAGGLLAKLASDGCDVRVLIASCGEGAFPGADEQGRRDLAELRTEESRQAARDLGLSSPDFLKLPDGGLEAHETTIAAAITEAGSAAPSEVMLLSHWKHDGHPDHEAVARAAAAAARLLRERGVRVRLLAFPIWALHWDSPQGGMIPCEAAVRAELDAAARERKRLAASRFRSQTEPWPAGSGNAPLMLPHLMTRLLDRDEWFVQEEHGGRRGLAGAAAEARPSEPEVHADSSDAVDSKAHIEGLYQRAEDPWDFETSPYEAHKRAATLAALPRSQYRFCFEPGCSIGMLTVELARRAERVEAWDPVTAPLERARGRIAELEASGGLEAGRVRFESRALGAGTAQAVWPESHRSPRDADLIVLSEVLYFLPPEELPAVLADLIERAAPGAHIVAVHWRHPVAGWSAGGAATHDELVGDSALTHVLRDDENTDFLIDVFEVARELPGAHSPHPAPG